MNAKAEEAEKLFNKMDNYTPLKKHEDISLSVQILAAMKHSNSNVERVLLPA